MVKARSSLLLLAGILLLGAFIWVQEVWRTQVPSKENRRIRLFDLSADTLVSIQFQLSSNLVVECVKENGVWMTGGTDRGLGRADVALVHKMIAGLNSMGKGTTITSEHLQIRGLDAAEYGFNDPSVEIIAVDNKGWHHWLIGREAPLGDMVYVKEGNKDEIYTVMDKLLAMVPQQPDTLRDRTLFPGNPAGVRRVEIRGSSGFFQILKDSSSEWQMQQPLSAAADPKAVEELLNQMYRLRIEEFEAENVSDFSAFGLQGETRQISLGGADGSSRMLMIGDAIADKPGFVYARRADDTAVFSLKADVLELLDIKHDTLRDARVLPLPANKVSFISISRGSEQLELISDSEGNWSVVNPVMWDADGEAVGELLDFWDIAVITDFNDTNLTAATEWTFLFGSDELGRTNRIEVLLAGDDRSGLRIKRLNEPAVYQINLPYIPDTLLDPLEFKDRQLWRIRMEEIQKIAIERPAKSRQVVERQPDGSFALGETNSMVRVDQDALRELLNKIASISTERFVSYNPNDLSIYGLTEPLLVLHMGLFGTNQLGRVLVVGQEAATGFYAMVKGQDVVFLLDKDLVGILENNLVEEREDPVVNPE
jgi:hypothetical protein